MTVLEILQVAGAEDGDIKETVLRYTSRFSHLFDDLLDREMGDIFKLSGDKSHIVLFLMPHFVLFFSRYLDQCSRDVSRVKEGLKWLTFIARDMSQMIQFEHLDHFGNLEWVDAIVEVLMVVFQIEAMYEELPMEVVNVLSEILSILFSCRENVLKLLENYSNVYPDLLYRLAVFYQTAETDLILRSVLPIARTMDERVILKLEDLISSTKGGPTPSAQNLISLIEDESLKLSPQNFRIVKMIGQGGFGNVYLVKSRNLPGERYFALKVMARQARGTTNIISRYNTEKEVLSRSNHPFILTLHYAFSTENNIYLLMQYCSGGDFYTFLKTRPHNRLSESDAAFYSAEVLLALQYIHVKGYVYRDLKPENILIHSSGHLILGDFDLCKATDCYDIADAYNGKEQNFRTRMITSVGTPDYLSPQVAMQDSYTRAVDWWCFGILIYEMLFGRTPFSGANFVDTVTNILDAPLVFPSLSETQCFRKHQISKDAKDLISKLLVRDESRRLSDSVQIMHHPFFKKIKFALIRNQVPPWVPTLTGSEDTRYVYYPFGSCEHLVLNKSIEDLHECFPDLHVLLSSSSPPSPEACVHARLLQRLKDPFEFVKITNPHWEVPRVSESTSKDCPIAK